MKFNNLKWFVVLGIAIAVLSGCSSANTTLTPSPGTRVATQTPWIIERVITATPEPATITPLPTAGVAVEAKTPTRTPTKAPVAAAKTATKPAPTVPVVAAPAASPTAACNLGSVGKLIWPDNGAPRSTSDTFDFQWTPFKDVETDPQVGYRIEIQSKKGSRIINGDLVDVQHNWFINNGKHYVYDKRRVQNLITPDQDEVSVSWSVTVVRITGSYDNNSGKSTGSVTPCGAPTGPFIISLRMVGS